MPSGKNILLINPWIYDFTAYDFWMKPLGLLYVAALLRKHTNSQLYFIDCLDRAHPGLMSRLKTKPDGRGPFWKEEVTKPSVLSAVPRKFSRYGLPVPLFHHELEKIPRPDLVLVSGTMTYWYPGVQFVIELIRQRFGRIPIALGGIYPTLMPDHARREIDADFVLEGPAERTIHSLVREVFGPAVSGDISCGSLYDLPWPAFDLLRDRTALPLLTSRGCPFGCSFCASPILFEGFEQIPPNAVVSLLEDMHRRYKTRHIAFYDDSLLLNKAGHIVPLLERIVESRLPLAFHTPNGLHIKEIDASIASLFRRANFQSLYLSQESFDPNILADACPKVSPDDLELALGHLTHAGYDTSAVNVYLLMGLPGQDVEGIRESILRVQKLGARPRLAYFSPVPKTKAWRILTAKGVFSENTDPLLHNKAVFPYMWGEISPEEFTSLKEMADNPPA